MNVAMLGAGSIALANAALLANAGHRVAVWSPSGRSTASPNRPSRSSFGRGDRTGDRHVARDLAAAIGESHVVILCAPAYGHAAIMAASAPYLTARHVVLVMPMFSSLRSTRA
jgi:opine dehydrogenase